MRACVYARASVCAIAEPPPYPNRGPETAAGAAIVQGKPCKQRTGFLFFAEAFLFLLAAVRSARPLGSSLAPLLARPVAARLLPFIIFILNFFPLHG